VKSLSQQNYPRLWLLFQYVFGAVRDKRRMATMHLNDHISVLEIGCSLGIVSAAFAPLSHTDFLGIDIDEQAIAIARRRFARYKHMKFSTSSLEDLASRQETFDYVIFANILHHVDDQLAVSLLRTASQVLKQGGTMFTMEPDLADERDSLYMKFLYKLEKGQYRRNQKHLLELIREAGVHVQSATFENISIGLLPGVVAGRMLMFTFSPASAT
jgi:2-polyprenyl-3-methyl-5-hydroxy-6-metoxy-1,4-benzoquinol methylase